MWLIFFIMQQQQEIYFLIVINYESLKSMDTYHIIGIVIYAWGSLVQFIF